MSEHGNEGTMPTRDETTELTADEAATMTDIQQKIREYYARGGS